ncbi:uncharacterized protein C3orf84 homolog isoform X2 [Pleurodeles waltl]|uniref:uncharacterized protein C3orf84 homolog isoform X2 n=1 Tax=Pleurodeles waltl TaxID=8319 RepID=UPI00370938A7
MESSITGSWFASGFHGNFRSRARDDILQAYRHEAQPQPPPLFLQRLKEDPRKHLFTKHENEQAVPRTVRNINEGTVTLSLVPKPQHPFNFLEWGPLQEELKRQRPPFTTYQHDFWKRGDYKTDKKIPQLLVPRLSLGRPLMRTPSTIYQHSYKRHPISVTDHLSRNGQVTPRKDYACTIQRESPRKGNTCVTQESSSTQEFSVKDYTCTPKRESPVKDYTCVTQQESPVKDYSCVTQQESPVKDYSCDTLQEYPAKDHTSLPQQEFPMKDYSCVTERESPAKDHTCIPQEEAPVKDYSCDTQREPTVNGYTCATQQEPSVKDYSCAAQQEPTLKDYSFSTQQECSQKDTCATPQKSPLKDYGYATQREHPVKDYSSATYTIPRRNKRIMSAPLPRITVSDCLVWPNLEFEKPRCLPTK